MNYVYEIGWLGGGGENEKEYLYSDRLYDNATFHRICTGILNRIVITPEMNEDERADRLMTELKRMGFRELKPQADYWIGNYLTKEERERETGLVGSALIFGKGYFGTSSIPHGEYRFRPEAKLTEQNKRMEYCAKKYANLRSDPVGYRNAMNSCLRTGV